MIGIERAGGRVTVTITLPDRGDRALRWLRTELDIITSGYVGISEPDPADEYDP